MSDDETLALPAPTGSTLGYQLTVVRGPAELLGRTLTFAGDVVLGRAEEAGLRLEVDGVSRRHATLVRTAEGVELLDLGSRNGTFRNGVREGRCLLSPGDVIDVGAAQLRFSLLRDEDEATGLRAATRAVPGLGARDAFLERLRGEFARAARFGTPLVLLFITPGSPGDEEVAQLARLLAERVRAGDVLTRSGAAVVVLCADCDAPGAAALTARLTEGTRATTTARPWEAGRWLNAEEFLAG